MFRQVRVLSVSELDALYFGIPEMGIFFYRNYLSELERIELHLCCDDGLEY